MVPLLSAGENTLASDEGCNLQPLTLCVMSSHLPISITHKKCSDTIRVHYTQEGCVGVGVCVEQGKERSSA